MMTIKTIIFSRDRALQLDGLLRSLFLHCGDADNALITVLYKATSERHACQYQKLAGEFAGRVAFRKQQHFRQDTLSILNPFEKDRNENRYSLLSAIGSLGFPIGSFLDRIWRRTLGQIQRFLTMRFIPSISDESHVFFLVDDNIFVRDFLLKDIVNTLRAHEDLIGFSMRLGENTTYCYSQNHSQALPEFVRINRNILMYDWTKSEYDFGYPLEISSSMYRLKDIVPFILGLPFENPNVLEERMAFYTDGFKAKRPRLGCYQFSVTFCNPVNMVQRINHNRAGEEFRYDVDDLAIRFENGERIRVEAYTGLITHACHQEVELVFEKLGM